MKSFNDAPWPVKAGLAAIAAGLAVALFSVLRPDAAFPDRAPRSGASFLDLAARVPIADAEQGVWFFDYARARSLAGVPQPPADTGQDTVRKYAEALSGKVVVSTGTTASPVARFHASSSVNWDDEIGFTFADIDQVLWTQGSPTRPSLAVASGRMQASRISQALQETSSWAKAVRMTEHGGVGYLTWDKPVPINPVWPSAGHVVAGEGIVTWTIDQTQIERSIEATSDPRRSLLRLPEMQQIAQALDSLGVYSAFYEPFLDESRVEANRDLVNGEYGRQFVSTQMLLEPYDSLLVGIGQRGESAYAVMILVHADEASANANVEKLDEIVESGTSFHTRRPWKDVIDKAEFEAVGTLVYGKIYAQNLRLTFDAWNNLDSLFLQ